MLEASATKEGKLNCPRCNSTNTKFCYYNNYSLTQPRYFCKTCKRYWTEGGSLRNVPVGGGSRKNKKTIPTLATTSSSSSSLKNLDPNPPSLQAHILNPKSSHAGQDLSLEFPATKNNDHDIPYYVHEVPKLENSNRVHYYENPCSTSSSFSALELLRSGMAPRGLSPYIPTLMPESDIIYPSGFPPQELKTTLDISRYTVPENNGRRVFSLAEMKNLSASNDVQQHKDQPNSIGYWNRVMGHFHFKFLLFSFPSIIAWCACPTVLPFMFSKALTRFTDTSHQHSSKR